MNVYKDPVTDHGKMSRKGRMTLEMNNDGEYITRTEGMGDAEKVGRAASGGGNGENYTGYLLEGVEVTQSGVHLGGGGGGGHLPPLIKSRPPLKIANILLQLLPILYSLQRMHQKQSQSLKSKIS